MLAQTVAADANGRHNRTCANGLNGKSTGNTFRQISYGASGANVDKITEDAYER